MSEARETLLQALEDLGRLIFEAAGPVGTESDVTAAHEALDAAIQAQTAANWAELEAER